MKNLAKWGIGLFFIGLFSGCGLFAEKSEYPPEVVLPKDSDIVMAMDFTKDGNGDEFKELVSKFPKLEHGKNVADIFWTMFGADVREDEVYQDYIEPIFTNDWKIVLGAAGDSADFLTSDDGFLDLENLDGDIYFAGWFDEESAMDGLMDYIVDSEGGEKGEESGVTYWLNPKGTVYFAKYKDIFWLSNRFEELDDIVARIESGEGFNKNEDAMAKLADISDTSLFYMYVAPDYFGEVLNAGDEEYGAGEMIDSAASFVVYVDDDGIGVSGGVDLTDSGVDFFDQKWAEPFLFNKVPGEKLAFYLESSSMLEIIDATFGRVSSFLFNYDLNFDTLLYKIGGEKGLSLVDNMSALAVYDIGGMLPGIVLYVAVNDEDKEAVNIYLDFLDSYTAGFISGFNEEISANGSEGNVLKSEVLAVNGQALRKIYVDWSEMPVDVALQYSALLGGNLDNFKLEAYYGMISEDVFVEALYPEFDKFYETSSVSENDRFMDVAYGMEEGNRGVFYFDTQMWLDFVERYLDLLKSTGMLTGEQLDVAEEIILYFRPIQYYVGLLNLNDDKVNAVNYFGIEEYEAPEE